MRTLLLLALAVGTASADPVRLRSISADTAIAALPSLIDRVTAFDQGKPVILDLRGAKLTLRAAAADRVALDGVPEHQRPLVADLLRRIDRMPRSHGGPVWLRRQNKKTPAAWSTLRKALVPLIAQTSDMERVTVYYARDVRPLLAGAGGGDHHRELTYGASYTRHFTAKDRFGKIRLAPRDAKIPERRRDVPIDEGRAVAVDNRGGTATIWAGPRSPHEGVVIAREKKANTELFIHTAADPKMPGSPLFVGEVTKVEPGVPAWCGTMVFGTIVRYRVRHVLRRGGVAELKAGATISVNVLHLGGPLMATVGGKQHPATDPKLFALGTRHVVAPYRWYPNPEAPHFCLSGGESDVIVAGAKP